MLSVAEINQIESFSDSFDFYAKCRINNSFTCFRIHSLEQIFMGETGSIKKAIDKQMRVQWLLDIGEDLGDNFLTIASIAITWKPQQNECYIGNLWVEPEYRGNGLATLILNEIITYADELGVILTLHAIPFVGPEKKPTHDDIMRLVDHYCRFGFKRIQNILGIRLGPTMVRLPYTEVI
jgi:GNAT superfamily N-acetyltransferase